MSHRARPAASGPLRGRAPLPLSTSPELSTVYHPTPYPMRLPTLPRSTRPDLWSPPSGTETHPPFPLFARRLLTRRLRYLAAPWRLPSSVLRHRLLEPAGNPVHSASGPASGRCASGGRRRAASSWFPADFPSADGPLIASPRCSPLSGEV